MSWFTGPEKSGPDLYMANILHVCGWFDPSGDVTRCVTELNRYSEHKHDVLVKWHHPLKPILQFPEPEGQSRDNSYVNERFSWADAIIYHLVGWNSPLGYNVRTLKPCAFRSANVFFNKQTWNFKCDQAFFANPMDEMYDMVASCHLGARDFLGKSTQFLPALMPIEDELYTPDWSDDYRRESKIAYIKHAEQISERLLREPFAHTLCLADQPHNRVLSLRRKLATITIDNVTEGHYGLAGTESLAQGIPTIAWNYGHTVEQLELIAPGVPSPFIHADDVRTAVKKAVDYSSLPSRRHQAREWIEKCYNSRYLIERFWEPFCDQLVRS